MLTGSPPRPAGKLRTRASLVLAEFDGQAAGGGRGWCGTAHTQRAQHDPPAPLDPPNSGLWSSVQPALSQGSQPAAALC